MGKIMGTAKKNNAQFYEHDDLTPIIIISWSIIQLLLIAF